MADTFIPVRLSYTASTPTALAEYQSGETIATPTNLQFLGSGRRILADFSSPAGSVLNRTVFQTSVLNGQTMLPVLPNGTNRVSGMQLFDSQDPENSSVMIVQNNGSIGQILMGATGTASQNSLVLGTSSTQRVVITPGGACQLSVPLQFGSYTMATLPSAAAFNGHVIEVSNASGGPKICRSNGSAWQIINTTTTVS